MKHLSFFCWTNLETLGCYFQLTGIWKYEHYMQPSLSIIYTVELKDIHN